MKPTPALTDLYARLAAGLKAKLGIEDTESLKLVADALSSVIAGELKLLYLFLSDNQNQQFPDTADPESQGGTLERIGRLYLKRDPFPATAGIYTLTITGTAGAVLRQNLTFQANENSNSPGTILVLDNEYMMPAGGTGTVTVRSLDAGSDFELLPGDQVVTTEPVLGITQLAVVASVTEQPVDAEDLEVYRTAVINAIRLRSQGGAKTDYRLWAADANGVLRVYPYVKQGSPGVVQIYVEATTAASTDGNGTPSPALLDLVGEVIEFNPDEDLPTNERGRRPATALKEILPVSPVAVDVAITGLAINNATVRATITENLNEFLSKVRPFIDGADLLRDRNDLLTAVKVQSNVNDSVGAGNSFIGFQLYVQGNPVNTYTFTLANIPYLRNVNIV